MLPVNVSVFLFAIWKLRGFNHAFQGIVKRIEEEVKETAKLPGDVKRNNKNLVRMRYEPINKIACKDQKS